MNLSENFQIYLDRKKATGASIHPYEWLPDLIVDVHDDLYFYPLPILDKPIVFDINGTKKEGAFNRKHIERLMAQLENGSYIVSFVDTKTEEYGLAMVAEKNLLGFLTENPIN